MGKKKNIKKPRKSVSLFESFLSAKAVAILISVNLAVFGLMSVLFPEAIPDGLILSPSSLLHGRFWTLLTSAFIHQSALHLLLNMAGLFVFGRVVEKELGTAKTFLIYFGALFLSMGFSAATYSLVFHKNIAIIGASGAVMGLVAAATLVAPLKITYEIILPLPVMMKGWMFFYADLRGFWSGEGDGVSHLAHLCGFLSVAFLVYFVSAKEQKKLQVGLLINIISFAVFLILRKWLLLG